VHWRNFLRFQGVMRSWLLETLPGQVEDLLPIIERWKPDVIVCDPTMWSPILILHEKYGLPVAVSCYFAARCPGRICRHSGLGLRLPVNAWDRALYRFISKSVDLASAGSADGQMTSGGALGYPRFMCPFRHLPASMPLYMVAHFSRI